jgi:hypothetical protein
MAKVPFKKEEVSGKVEMNTPSLGVKGCVGQSGSALGKGVSCAKSPKWLPPKIKKSQKTIFLSDVLFIVRSQVNMIDKNDNVFLWYPDLILSTNDTI